MNTLTAQPKTNGQYPKQRVQAPATEEIEAVPLVLKLRNILVPIDFSPASEKALRHAVAFARQFGAKITLLYVSQAQLQANEFAYMPVEESAVRWCGTARLESIARREIAPEIPVETLVRTGVAFDEIVKAAKELNADLIVVNTHGYTGLKHILVGSTAERIVRHAPCPVLVVRECDHDLV